VRLSILDHGHTLGKKALFWIIRTASRQPVPEALKLVAYRGDFYGDAAKEITHEAMRGPSAWTVAERELMAAIVSQANACEFCVRAHTAVASRAYADPEKVSAALRDLDAAPLAPVLRVTLRLLEKWARGHALDPGELRAALDAGVTQEQLEDALAIAFAFDVTNRLANAFAFDVPPPAAFEAGAKFLLARGYR